MERFLKLLGFGGRKADMTDEVWRNTQRDRERRMHSYILYLLLGGTFWAIQTLWDVSGNIREIKPRLNAIEVQLSGSYTAREAARDVGEVKAHIERNEQRIYELDGRVTKLEAVRK